jgi:hypothetical protein
MLKQTEPKSQRILLVHVSLVAHRTRTQAVRHTDSARWPCTQPPTRAPGHRDEPRARRTSANTNTNTITLNAAVMVGGGGDPRPEDEPFSDGDATESDTDESPPQGISARRPGATTNPILTRLAVSRNPSPLAAATAAPGVCLLRFAWESAAGSLVGAVVGYGKPTRLSSALFACPV